MICLFFLRPLSINTQSSKVLSSFFSNLFKLKFYSVIFLFFPLFSNEMVRKRRANLLLNTLRINITHLINIVHGVGINVKGSSVRAQMSRINRRRNRNRLLASLVQVAQRIERVKKEVIKSFISSKSRSVSTRYRLNSARHLDFS